MLAQWHAVAQRKTGAGDESEAAPRAATRPSATLELPSPQPANVQKSPATNMQRKGEIPLRKYRLEATTLYNLLNRIPNCLTRTLSTLYVTPTSQA